MTRVVLTLLLFGCASQTSPAVVEIPPQPPPVATLEPDHAVKAEPPAPAPAPSATAAEQPPEEGPWSQGLPPAAGPSASQALPPRPVLANTSSDCATPFWYDAQGVKHYKPACLKPIHAPVPTVTNIPPPKPFPAPPPMNRR